MNDWIIWFQILITPMILALAVAYIRAITDCYRTGCYWIGAFMASAFPLIIGLFLMVWVVLPRITP